MSECQIVDSDGAVRCMCDVDEVLSLLADSRRRTIVRTLDRAPKNWIDRESLIDSLSATGSESMTPDEWALELAHVHLPLLEDCGLVEYDAHSEAIRYYECELASRVLASIERTTG
ncbi:ArsR family transcriptional regulator [Natrinema sp. 1APR25-10V2]|uniref:DUF7344 domain-containing protein n=1 Tax=Natrinema sp. 1APR25-10V2 TaxID=2951081 RepID=UPI002874B192|nr:ArsR family transcriptional regulator [Natrinema sp. 1APR25-10V2]MDS0477697.1 ArsR family transcriptional regulator [Natrinema sp. 1APR25-10V2]